MSMHMYHVCPVEYACRNYDIKINGIPVTPDTARVSAMPFNRRWPGHQRQLDQTELINFVSMAMDQPVHFEITPKEPFDTVTIRPLSLEIVPEITGGTICFTLEHPAYFTVEPYGRHNALHIFADPMPDYQVNPTDENVIYFGKGFYEAGIITLKSNQTLFIDEGAVVYACVHATDAHNIKILGRGILDNSHNKEKILFEVNEEHIADMEDVGNAERLHTIQLEYCTDVEIDGITIRDSLVYNIRPVACRNLNIRNVKIIGCWRFNSDGIDMHNCETVRICDCFLRTYDDSICVKGFDFYMEDDPEEATNRAIHHNGEVYDVCRDVIVENCTIWNDWGKCLEIGAETRAREICDIYFRNCHVIHVCNGVLTCSNGDNALVHDVVYENITVEYEDEIPTPALQFSDSETYVNQNKDYAPPLISVCISYIEEYSRSVQERGNNRSISFNNISLYGRHTPMVQVIGYDEGHTSEDVLVENLSWNGNVIQNPADVFVQTNAFVKNICINGFLF